MSNEKPFKLDMNFAEALKRLAQTDPKEIAQNYEQIKEKEQEVDRWIREQEDIIRNGEKRPRKRFRL